MHFKNIELHTYTLRIPDTPHVSRNDLSLSKKKKKKKKENKNGIKSTEKSSDYVTHSRKTHRCAATLDRDKVGGNGGNSVTHKGNVQYNFPFHHSLAANRRNLGIGCAS